MDTLLELGRTLPAGIPRIGEIFAEKYRIERVLGLGGMGIVLSATHIHLEERVAIKLLLPAIASNPEYVARFLREGRAAIKIRSEHVGRMIDVGRPAVGPPYLVMEYLQGTDLARVLEQRKTLPIPLAVDYLLQACEALAEAHAMGTIHRDLKPGNLFLTMRPDGTDCVKVLDFGISKIADGITPSSDFSMTKSTTLMGSPIYMSPEQLRSLRSVDCRTDIWALGVILFEMLAGSPPFQGDTLPDLSVKIIVTEPPLLRSKRPDAPEGLEAAISRCLEKDSGKRVADIQELASLLAPFGSPAAADSLDAINKVLVPSSPQLDSSQRLTFRDRASSSNPVLIAEGAAKTEVVWDTLHDPEPVKKKLPGYVLGGFIVAVMLGIIGGVGVVAFVVHKTPARLTPPAPPAVPSETATASAAPSASASAPEPLATASASAKPEASAKPHPPKPPAGPRPIAPVLSAPPPKPTAPTPTGVTLDRHG